MLGVSVVSALATAIGTLIVKETPAVNKSSACINAVASESS
jgi:hypothetical protein